MCVWGRLGQTQGNLGGSKEANISLYPNISHLHMGITGVQAVLKRRRGTPSNPRTAGGSSEKGTPRKVQSHIGNRMEGGRSEGTI